LITDADHEKRKRGKRYLLALRKKRKKREKVPL